MSKEEIKEIKKYIEKYKKELNEHEKLLESSEVYRYRVFRCINYLVRAIGLNSTEFPIFTSGEIEFIQQPENKLIWISFGYRFNPNNPIFLEKIK